MLAVPSKKKRCAHNTSGQSTLSSSTPLSPQVHRVWDTDDRESRMNKSRHLTNTSAASGCLTNHENKIPVDFQEFPVNILSSYFNTIYTVDAIFRATSCSHRNVTGKKLHQHTISITTNVIAPWNFKETWQKSSRIPGFPVEKKIRVDFQEC